MSASIINFDERLNVSRAECRALLRWFRNLPIVHFPQLAHKNGGRFIVINGGKR